MKWETRLQRFFSRFTKGDGCWEWEGGIGSNGYGLMNIGGVAKPTHRLSWEVHVGPIPDGMCVCHSCDNPKCVRPDHLFLGTASQNALDRHQKQRDARGTHHGMTKLTEDQVKFIRSSSKSHWSLAVQFNVARSLIYAIKHRRIWTHIT